MPATLNHTNQSKEFTPVNKTERPVWVVALELTVQTLFAIGLLALCLECMFALAGIGEQEYLKIDKIAGFAPMENKNVTWRKEGFGRVKFNSLGLQDQERSLAKPANTFRIAVLGDSFVEALQVDRRQNFCSLLEEKLNQEPAGTNHFEVINCGCSAYNVGQMYLRLKEKAMPLKPDLVFLVLSVDTTKNLAPLQGGFAFSNARPTFVLDDEGKLKLDYRIFDAWRLSPDGKRMKNTSWLRQHSHIWGVLGTIMGNLSSCQQDILTGKIWGSGIQTTQQPLISKHKSAEAVSGATTSKTAMIAAAQHLPQMQGDVSSETIKLWPVAQAVLKEMKSLCRENGARFGIVRLAGRPEVGYANPLETSLLKAEAQLDDTPYVDLSAAFDKAKNEGKTLFYTVHLAPDGHKVAANELSSFLKNRELLKR